MSTIEPSTPGVERVVRKAARLGAAIERATHNVAEVTEAQRGCSGGSPNELCVARVAAYKRLTTAKLRLKTFIEETCE